jgi:hypothetical protein
MEYTALITELEKKFWDANVNRDLKFFDEMLADEAVTIAGFGFADKRTIIQSVAIGAVRFADCTMSDIKVLPLGVDAASISYRGVVQAAVQGQPHTIVVNATTIYARRGDTWKIVLHQQTPAR